MNETSAVRAVVHGRVQGVTFRYFTYRLAEALGLKGYVRNLPDGSVEAYFEGEKSKLKAIITDLHEGPPAAKVERVEIDWQEPRGEHANFQITY